MNEDVEKKEVTLDSPEVQELLNEIMSMSATIQKREELSQESFRDWLCEIVEIIADKMGYVIQNLKEIPLDFAYSFGKGFSAGRAKARENSYRYRDKQKGE